MNWIKKKVSHFYHVLSNKKLYQFGALLLILLVLLFFFKEGAYRWIFIGLAGGQILGFIFPIIFRVEFTLISLLTYPVGTIVSFILLAVVYYLILCPIGFFRSTSYEEGWKPATRNINSEKMYE